MKKLYFKEINNNEEFHITIYPRFDKRYNDLKYNLPFGLKIITEETLKYNSILTENQALKIHDRVSVEGYDIEHLINASNRRIFQHKFEKCILFYFK